MVLLRKTDKFKSFFKILQFSPENYIRVLIIGHEAKKKED